MALNQPTIPCWAKIADHIIQRLVHRHLSEVLSIVTRRDTSADLELSGGNGMLAHQCSNERRLTGAIRTNESHDLSTHERAGEVVNQHTITDLHSCMLRGY